MYRIVKVGNKFQLERKYGFWQHHVLMERWHMECIGSLEFCKAMYKLKTRTI